MSSSPHPIVPAPAGGKGPLLVLGAMFVLFFATLSVVITGYLRDQEDASAPQSRRANAPADSRPASAPADLTSLPAETSFSSRNLEWGGNVAPLEGRDAAPLDVTEAEQRLGVEITRATPEAFARGLTQLPARADLLAQPQLYRGRRFNIHCIPMEINPHATDLPSGRVYSWRIYCILQRNLDEFVVFETFDEPPSREWILQRTVISVDALFLRTATYETQDARNKIKTIPYLFAKTFSIVQEASGTSATSVFAVLFSKYGPALGVGILAFVGLTFWTLRRFNSAQEKAEREYFYTMLRAKKRPGTVAAAPASKAAAASQPTAAPPGPAAAPPPS